MCENLDACKFNISADVLGVTPCANYNHYLNATFTCEREWRLNGMWCHGPLTGYVEWRVAHAPGMPGTFSPSPRVSDPDMHHDTSVMHVPWCMPGSLTGGFLWSRWREKCSRHSRRMRNPQFTYLVRDICRAIVCATFFKDRVPVDFAYDSQYSNGM